MESAHRYRLLIYFAALILCLSVCFANAEVVHAAAPQATVSATSAPFLFQTSQTHATFMPVLEQGFVHEAVAKTAEPVVSESTLRKLTMDTQKSHRLFHGVSFAKRRPALIVSHAQEATGSMTDAMQDSSQNQESAGQTE